jgi:hypothetical protein
VRLPDLRVHDAAGPRLRIVDAKTEAGIREVQISPDLAEELVANIDRLRRARQAIDPDSKMTTDVYAQLQQRVRRQHGRAFDLLVRRARERLYGSPTTEPESLKVTPPIGPGPGPRVP